MQGTIPLLVRQIQVRTAIAQHLMRKKCEKHMLVSNGHGNGSALRLASELDARTSAMPWLPTIEAMCKGVFPRTFVQSMRNGKRAWYAVSIRTSAARVWAGVRLGEYGLGWLACTPASRQRIVLFSESYSLVS